MENIPHALKMFLSPNFYAVELKLQYSANALKTAQEERGINIHSVSASSSVWLPQSSCC